MREVTGLFICLLMVVGQPSLATLRTIEDSGGQNVRLQDLEVSHAMVVETNAAGEQVAVCAVDVSGRPDLVPQFMKATEQSAEPIDLPHCGADQMQKVSYVASVGSPPVVASIGGILVAQCAAVAAVGGGAAVFGGDKEDVISMTRSMAIGAMAGSIAAGVIFRIPFRRTVEIMAVGTFLAVACGGVSGMIAYKLANPNQ